MPPGLGGRQRLPSRLPAARQSGRGSVRHVPSASQILFFTQLIPELGCDPISRHFILSRRFPGAPPTRSGTPRSRQRSPGAPSGRAGPGTGRPPRGVRGKRRGRAAPAGAAGVSPPQGTPLPSLAAYDSWCGVAHGCTRKIGLKICGKSARPPGPDPAPGGGLGLPLSGTEPPLPSPPLRSPPRPGSAALPCVCFGPGIFRRPSCDCRGCEGAGGAPGGRRGEPTGVWPPRRLKFFSLIGVENTDLLGEKD